MLVTSSHDINHSIIHQRYTVAKRKLGHLAIKRGPLFDFRAELEYGSIFVTTTVIVTKLE
jgi:hypothetical protein